MNKKLLNFMENIKTIKIAVKNEYQTIGYMYIQHPSENLMIDVGTIKITKGADEIVDIEIKYNKFAAEISEDKNVSAITYTFTGIDKDKVIELINKINNQEAK